MGYKRHQPSFAAVWAVASQQHGLIARWQLLRLGMSSQAIKHRLGRSELHRVAQGVYAVGRPQDSVHGRWMAAVLSCGSGALLSHGSAAALWGIGDERPLGVEVSLPAGPMRRRPGVTAHRRARLYEHEHAERHLIPVTAVATTLVDVASYSTRPAVLALINAADREDLLDPDALRLALTRVPGRPGLPAIRDALDRLTFVLTDSELERRFLPLARAIGLPKPQAGVFLNGFKVDFFWPDLGLVVETDGLRYHRTPAQQARDRVRDNAHLAAGLTPLRFTHGQVRYEPGYVRATLATTVRRLRNRTLVR